jgi:hypothetical protein
MLLSRGFPVSRQRWSLHWRAKAIGSINKGAAQPLIAAFGESTLIDIE